jgi:hypothetical protein
MPLKQLNSERRVPCRRPGKVSQGNFVDLRPVGADQLVGMRRRRPQNHRG